MQNYGVYIVVKKVVESLSCLNGQHNSNSAERERRKRKALLPFLPIKIGNLEEKGVEEKGGKKKKKTLLATFLALWKKEEEKSSV